MKLRQLHVLVGSDAGATVPIDGIGFRDLWAGGGHENPVIHDFIYD
jgi:hypothetical protein